MKLLIATFFGLLLVGCTTLPMSFTTDNIMKVHQGMSSDEILEMFGKPKSIRQDVCGVSTGEPWNCTTWRYGESPYETATFTFSGKTPDSLVLNNFEVDRD